MRAEGIMIQNNSFSKSSFQSPKKSSQKSDSFEKMLSRSDRRSNSSLEDRNISNSKKSTDRGSVSRGDENSQKEKRENLKPKEDKTIEEKVDELKKLMEDMDSEELDEALSEFVDYLSENSVDLESLTLDLGSLNLEDIDLKELLSKIENLFSELKNLDLKLSLDSKELAAIEKTLSIAEELLSRLEGLETGNIGKDISKISESQLKLLENFDLKDIKKSIESARSFLEEVKNTKSADKSSEVDLREFSKKLENRDSDQANSKALGQAEKNLTLETMSKGNPEVTEGKIDLVERGFSRNLLKDINLAHSEKNVEIRNLRQGESFDFDKVLLNQNFKNEFNHNMHTIINKDIPVQQSLLNMDKLDIIKQISSKIGLSGTDSLNEIKIKLSPESLGNLTIKVTLDDGVINARAIVENPHVKELLESNINLLKDSLKDQGVNFEKIDVFVGEDPNEREEFNRRGFEDQARDGRNKSREDIELEDLEELLNEQVLSSDRVDAIV